MSRPKTPRRASIYPRPRRRQRALRLRRKRRLRRPRRRPRSQISIPSSLPPAANDGSTRYGIEIGTVAKQDGLRPLWREFLTNHAALVAGLQPRRVLAPDKKWRLVAGPFANAAEAEQACALFKKASRPCEATVYAGDGL